MCGRYVSTKSTSDLLAEFDAVEAADAGGIEPDYNVAPTKSVRTVVNRVPHKSVVAQADAAEPEAAERDTAERETAERESAPSRPAADGAQPAPVRQLRIARWGLVPSWAKDLSAGNRMFNARAESVPDKAPFKRAFAKRRCLIPADGWYEWLRDTDTTGKPRKQPFFITPQDGRSLALAGLYEFWRPNDAPEGTDLLLSVTVLTVAAQGELAEIHERMPLVLSRRDWTRWLDPAIEAPTDLLAPRDEAAEEALELRPVSDKVNSAQNNSADLLDRVQPAPPALELF
jgi:putative SOS response-associated peptidase YedK